MESQACHPNEQETDSNNESSGSLRRPHKHGSITSDEEAISNGTTVVKIGGSILGTHDTTLEDLAALQSQGINPVVVHGGGKVISQWMHKQGVMPKFVRGLRVTDAASLDVVVAVLTGLINKSLVASLLALGARAVGISGADGGMLQAKIRDPILGLVGNIVKVDIGLIMSVLESGCIPVIAPVAVNSDKDPKKPGSLLNVNADTAAGEIAAALSANRLVFLTDVEGVLDSSRRLIPRLTRRQATGLISSNLVAGGMIPKLEACLTALGRDSITQIVDGRRPKALLDVLAGKATGSRIG